MKDVNKRDMTIVEQYFMNDWDYIKKFLTENESITLVLRKLWNSDEIELFKKYYRFVENDSDSMWAIGSIVEMYATEIRDGLGSRIAMEKRFVEVIINSPAKICVIKHCKKYHIDYKEFL